MMFLFIFIVGGKILYDQMIKTLYEAQTLSYRSEIKEWRKENHEEVKERFCWYKIMLKKPYYLKYETEGGFIVCNQEKAYLCIFGPPPFDGVYHGKAIGMADKTYYIYKNTYFDLKGMPYSIRTMTTAVGECSPIMEPDIFFVGFYKWGEYADTIIGGTDTLENQEVNTLEISIFDGQRIQKFWVSKTTYLPIKIKQIINVDNPIIIEETWRDVKINQPISNDTFNWNPTENWEKGDSQFFITQPTLPKGVKPPPFSCETIREDTISLSKFENKIVWLFFWKVGCPPCRKGFPYIQKIYEKFKDKGLCVIGFNWCDNKEIVLKFLSKYEVTFPIILDNSKYATEVARKYGGWIFPLNYIIDKNGTVFDSYVGYDGKEYQEIIRILEKLGLK